MSKHHRTESSKDSREVDSTSENDLELFDMLCVALHFAGLKRSALKQILQAYSDELDSFDEDAPYGQEQMIAIIHTLQEKYPQAFHSQAISQASHSQTKQEQDDDRI